MKFENIYDAYLTARGAALASNDFRKSQHWNKCRLDEYKYNKLRELLIFSYRNIPFYQKRFWDFDFDPYCFQSLEDLEKIPILTKSILKKYQDQFCAASQLKRSLVMSTSGSTGTPMQTYTSPEQWIVEQACVWRQWRWAGYQFRDKVAVVRSYAPKDGEPLWKYDRLRNWMYFSPYHLSEENLLQYLKVLKGFAPKFLRGYPSSLYLLAKVAKKNGITLPTVKAAFTASEVLLGYYREEIESAFDIKVFDHYGQAEITAMLHECERHEGMHILEDYSHVELLPNGEGGEHRLIATNLHNKAMPLIRYDTGDSVQVSGKNCGCGRGFRCVKHILGRSDQMLLHRNNFFIPSINFYTFFSKQKEVLQFQIIQKSIERVEVRVQAAKDSNEYKVKEVVQKEMESRFGGSVVVLLTDEFVQMGEGKHNVIVQEAL